MLSVKIVNEKIKEFEKEISDMTFNEITPETRIILEMELLKMKMKRDLYSLKRQLLYKEWKEK